MNMNNVLNGLIIFKKYCEDCEFSVGHDIIYAACGNVYKNISEDDEKILKDNKWYYSEEYDCYKKFV